MKKLAFGLMLILSQSALGYVDPTSDFYFYIPNYPSKLSLYISNPTFVCSDSTYPNLKCSAPIPADHIVYSGITTNISFFTPDGGSRSCTYEVTEFFNSKLSIYQFESAYLTASKNMNCDQYIDSNLNAWKVDY